MTSLRIQGIGMTSQRTRDRLIARLKEEGIKSIAVLNAMRATPRHLFVDEALASRAYEDTALPIGHGQTISQPYIVARMTEALLEGGLLQRVLEVGTGSGYQTAVLARLVSEVFSVERIKALLLQAQGRFRDLGLRNIRAKYSDGTMGMPESAPFDGIMVTAAPEGIPLALVRQLAVGGRMVLPVGDRDMQVLVRVTRTEDGYEKEMLERVVFVPLLGGVV
ncbi:MAG: protein-L-isoaspartate O-methyltransferase [Gammaproteobacteria bacterium RIFOXYA12_FULL_61_12]|nr:MAG: protein-L-isoaspartate O-methyltransferase [Gammaproteobacteria bacterium RIFOXYD12_FULL_61_37]OGT91187.1 MAG: protein-L-isoaspartate O-methyltransferase [Gammaproteobacteria bacterium RIFOXYA12_FULL_61_12]